MKIKYIFNILTIVILVILYPAITNAYLGNIESLDANNYFSKVQEALRNAKKSINMAMYLMVLGEKENRFTKLIEELVKAHERGVKVNVLLDKKSDILGKEQETELSNYCLTDNNKAYDYLNSKGIYVKYNLPNPDNILHFSLIIIDERIVIAGSTYWAEPIVENIENAFLIESTGLARKCISDINSIPTE